MTLQDILEPRDAASLAVERAVAVAVTAALGVLLVNWNLGTVGKWGVAYWVLKTLYDFIVKNIPNWPAP